MTATELAKRNQRSEQLRVIQVGKEEGIFYVESGEGKICYKVTLNDREVSCTCGDFARGVKSEENFRCKHILSVIKSNVKDIESGEVLEKRVPKLDPRFVKTIDGKDYVLYAGLLDLAHQKGLKKIEVEPLQFPSQENQHFAVCKTTVLSMNDETFSDVGDADKSNCNSRVAKHLLRMASTRSIARALRSYTNISMTCLEELEESDLSNNGPSVVSKYSKSRKETVTKTNGKKDDSKHSNPGKEPSQQASTESTKTNAKKEEKADPDNESNQENLSGVPKMSEAQKRAVHNLSRRRGISVDEMERMCQESYQTNLENLSSKNAALFIRELQTAA